MTSQGIPEDLKQQLAKKEAEKEQKGREIKELVEERKKLETKLLETTDKEQAVKLEAAIKSVKEDIDSLRGEIPALNDQIKFLLGECDFFSLPFGEITKFNSPLSSFISPFSPTPSQSQAVRIRPFQFTVPAAAATTRVLRLSRGRYLSFFF